MDINYEQLTIEKESFQELNAIVNNRGTSRKNNMNKTIGNIVINKNKYWKYVLLICGCVISVVIVMYMVSLKKEVNVLRNTNKEMNEMLEEIGNNRTILYKSIQELEGEQNEITTSNKQLSETLISVEEKNKKLLKDQESHEKSIKDMRNRLEDSMKQLSDYQKLNEELHIKITKLQKANIEYQEEINELQNEINISNLQYNPMSIDSKIITSNEEISTIKEWIGNPKEITFKLLYRASRDGFTPSIFHSKVDNHKNTLSLIQSNLGNIFGGYTSVTWNPSPSYENEGLYKYDNTAFIFNLDHNIIFHINNPEKAVYAHPLYFSSFGKGDIMITSNLYVSSFLSSYGKCQYETPEKLVGTLEEEIEVEELEVFQLIS